MPGFLSVVWPPSGEAPGFLGGALEGAGLVQGLVVLGVRIAVGSGKVVINPDDRPVALDAGRSFVRPASGGPATLGNIDPADMASWRSDRLSYRDTPLPMVASDLSRALGVPVKIGAGLSKTRLTGVIPVGGEQSDVVAGAAALAGATAQRSEAGWLISLP